MYYRIPAGISSPGLPEAQES